MDGTSRKDDLLAGGSTVPLDPETLAERAAAALDPGPRAYLVGGAETEGSVRENRRAFDRWRIRPRVLRDTSTRDHRVTVGDERLSHPVALAPIGMQSLYDDQAEEATARAAGRTGTALCLSTVSSVSLEAVAREQDAAAEADGGTETPVRWFQAYWSGREVTASMVRRAERAGYSALVLTVDTPVTGWRTRELSSEYVPFDHGHGLANYASDPVVRERLGDDPDDEAVAAVVAECLGDASLDWDDVAWLRERTALPLYLKGVMHPDDAARAADVADGVVVSNHGGRQVDGELAALDALEPVAEAVDNRVPVLFDSGIRTGADVFRALALGADAVLLGRPYCSGLTLAGEDGVRDVVRNLRAAFDLTLELSGYAAAESVDREAVVRVARG
ncbi:alpha-hydroxy-acid oxidizing protein [Salinigranum rubrum]|nr:alpha-hydroxy-acid oxidizing protein [Salinigranum rubrum]